MKNIIFGPDAIWGKPPGVISRKTNDVQMGVLYPPAEV